MHTQPPASPLSQDELKALVGRAALAYVVPGQVLGVGTGSTVNHFIDALASMRDAIPGAVSSSEASTQRLQAVGIRVLDGLLDLADHNPGEWRGHRLQVFHLEAGHGQGVGQLPA